MTYQRKRYMAEGGLALLLVMISIILFVRAPNLVAGWAFNIPGTTDVSLAPSFFPRLAAIALGLASLSVIATLHMRSGPLPLLDTRRLAYAKSALGFAAIVALVLLLPITGFIVTSALFIFGAAAAGGYRRWSVLVPTAIIIPVVLKLAFRYGLHIALPAGFLF
jgi:hypothetical protein